MWPVLQRLFGEPASAALISMFVGAAITWFVAWRYYKKAGDELRAETSLLRKANMVIAYILEHPGADVEVKRDDNGNPVALILSTTGHASGKATVKGVMSDAKGDS